MHDNYRILLKCQKNLGVMEEQLDIYTKNISFDDSLEEYKCLNWQNKYQLSLVKIQLDKTIRIFGNYESTIKEKALHFHHLSNLILDYLSNFEFDESVGQLTNVLDNLSLNNK